MKRRNVAMTLVSLTLIFASSALAKEMYVCAHGERQRMIRVVYDNEGSAVPCNVTYEKSTGTQVLWRANTEKGYCESMAHEFADTLRKLGWDCVRNEATRDKMQH